MTRLCILIAALAVVTRARVAVLPGWVIPVPVLIVAAEALLLAAAVAWLVCRTPRIRPFRYAPERGRAV